MRPSQSSQHARIERLPCRGRQIHCNAVVDQELPNPSRSAANRFIFAGSRLSFGIVDAGLRLSSADAELRMHANISSFPHLCHCQDPKSVKGPAGAVGSFSLA